MRIVLISVQSPWDDRHGGGQLCTHYLAISLARRGHEVIMVYSAIGGVPPEGTPANLPYRVEFVPDHERLYLNPVEFARRVHRLKGAVDVIHNKGYEGAFLWDLPRRGGSGRGALRRSPLRIGSTHHPDPPDLSAPPGWTRPLHRARWTRANILALLERRTLVRADAVICTSHHSARVLRERGYFGPDTSVHVVHNGSPIEKIERTANGTGKGGADGASWPASLLCIARLDEHKGIDVLFRALAQLGDLDVRLDLVGTGLTEARLREEAKRLGVSSRVRWHGYKRPDEIAALLGSAHMLVLPSRSENFPLVILEAMHAGLPIVATAVGGIPEAVRDGREALLVAPENPEALAGALRRLLEDDGLRAGLAAAARARADEFTWDRAAERTEQIYFGLRG